MTIEEDPEYISFLSSYYARDNPYMRENQSYGVSSPIRDKPKRKRTRHDLIAIEAAIKESVGKRTRLESDLFRLERRRKGNKEEGTSGREILFCSSDGRIYDSDYINYTNYLKVSRECTAPTISGGVIVRNEQEGDLVDELKREINSFEKERENLVGEYEWLEEGVQKKRCLEVKLREKTLEKERNAVVERGGKVLADPSSSSGKLEIQSENGSVIAQVVKCTEAGNRMKIRKEKEGKSGKQKENLSEEAEIETSQVSPQPEPVNPYFQLLVQELCPVETTIYPGWPGNDGEIRPFSKPSKSMEKEPKQVEKINANSSCPRGFIDFEWIEEKIEEELVMPRHMENKIGYMNKALAAFPELSDTDEPTMDVPVEILRRPSSDYKDRLMKELKKPFDKYEYKELMKEATLKTKKIVYKDLRSTSERAVETGEYSNSIFDWYPEVKRKVERARSGCRLILLRGLFFWIQNCCWEGSFKPWRKWRKGSTAHHINNSEKLQ